MAAIVIGGGAEGLLRQPPVRLERERAADRAQLLEDRGVIGGRDDDGDVLIILGGGADHGGAADIDVLDQLFERARRPWRRLLRSGRD